MIQSKIVAFILLLFALSSAAFAQDIEKSNKKERIGGTEYYIHSIAPGQTIYGISKAYSVSMSDILDANPDAKKGLKAGSVLKIPVAKSEKEKKFIVHKVKKSETLYEISFNYNVKVSDILSINPGLTEKISNGQEIMIPITEKKQPVPVSNTPGVHVVTQGETIYSISKQFSVSPEELKKLNPGLTETLQVGQQMVVPAVDLSEKHETKKDSIVTTADCGKTGLQNIYRVALLIPFYLDKSYSIDTADEKAPVSSYKSLSFIQFYEGARVALDSLENAGLSLMVYVYDVNENTNANDLIRQKAEMKNMDLVIGPFFMNNFEQFAVWANEKGINIINPFTQKEAAIKGNNRVFKMVSSDSSQAAGVLQFIAKTYPGCNLILVDRKADTALTKAFKNAQQMMNREKQLFRFNYVDYSSKGYAGLSGNLAGDTINVVLTLAQGEAFVSAYIRSLNESAHNYKIVLFGLPSWEQYSSLDLEYLMNLNLHIFESYFIDYSKSGTSDFVRSFRQKYGTEPDYYAFQGYDIVMFFCEALKKYGRNFQDCITQKSLTSLISDYSFRKTAFGGYENTSCMIYRYDGYKIINALINPKKEIRKVEMKKP